MALAKLRSISLLTLLEPTDNTVGTTQTANSSNIQPLVLVTAEACHLLTHTASAARTTDTNGQLLLLLLEIPKTLQPISHCS